MRKNPAIATTGEQKSPFWAFQITGWSLLLLATLGVNLVRGNDHWTMVTLAAVVAGAGFTTTSLYRLRVRSFTSTSIRAIVAPLFGGSLLASALWSAVVVLTQYLLWRVAPNQAPPLDRSGVILTGLNNYFVVLLWAIIYFAWHYFRLAQTARMERYRSEMAVRDAQLNTLKGQINPHFMFNALNNIRAMMLEDATRSRDMLLKLSELLRYSMNMTEKREVSLKDELSVVRDFLALNKIQYEERLNYSVHVDEAVGNLKIPPMIIQILVENSVKHGVSALSGGGDVQVTVVRDGERLVIEVSNSGSWSLPTGISRDNNGIGLPNVRKRLKLLYGDNALLHLSEQNQRVVARIEIPISHG